MNILAVGAHPADVFDLAGGTLANFAQDGHGVHIVSITHGAFSHSQAVTGKDQQQAVEEIKALKQRESDSAASAIGAKETRYLPYDDEPFIPTREAIVALGEYIREVNPDIMITHHPREYGHPDHPVAGDVSLRAAKAAERWLGGSTRKPHKINRIYFYGTQFRPICTTVGSEVVPPDFVVDIADSIDKKIQAIAAFQSQSFMGSQYEDKWARDRAERMEGHWGFIHGLRYAEEFIAFSPQVVRLLP